MPVVEERTTAVGGGGSTKTSFTNANYQTLVNHPGKYDGAHVDATGQLQTVTTDEQQITWLLVYMDPKHASQATLVEVPHGTSATASSRGPGPPASWCRA